jgi:hypothetical protein
VDPATGELGPPPPGTQTETSVSRAATAPLVEQPAPTDGGGVMLDLGETLMYSHQARVDENGKVKTSCEQRPQ